jgi:hypothetical protein
MWLRSGYCGARSKNRPIHIEVCYKKQKGREVIKKSFWKNELEIKEASVQKPLPVVCTCE